MSESLINGPVSDSELTRRAQATREAMQREGIDVLLASSNSDELGGYIKYLTDLPAGGYGTTLIFPREGEPVLITHGMLDSDIRPAHDPVLRGVGRVLSSPYFPAAPYTRLAPAELVVKALSSFEQATVGLVGTTQIPMVIGEHVRRQLPDAEFVEASHVLDEVKIVKSLEEQELIRQTAAIQDEAMRAALEAAAPGRRESEIANVATHVASDLGAEAGIVLIGSGPIDGGWTIRPRHLQERVLEQGDMIAILIELNGPGGMFAELGRSAVLGAVPEAAKRELRIVLDAQRFTLDRLRPGRAYNEIWHEYNAFLAEHGRPQEQRIHCHGQGVDLVERPLVRFDEPGVVQAGTNLACHPTWTHGGQFSWICDNYLIGENGPGERLHSTPQEIFAL